jgi:hypothetical protein
MKELAINKLKKQKDNKVEAENVVFEKSFKVALADTMFMMGYIRFEKFIKIFNRTIEFKLYNDNILPEYYNVKYWIIKALGNKQINVTVSFKSEKDYTATSTDIDKIKKGFIEKINLNRTISLIKAIRPRSVEKSLFTIDTVYSINNNCDLIGNIFNQTEEALFEIIIENKDIRNKRELSYLYDEKHAPENKLRITNSPNFGFLFLVEGKKKNHFVWELLNSSITFIWSIDKKIGPMGFQYNRIEKTINFIMQNSREIYPQEVKNKAIDTDLIFNTISHLVKGKDIDASFLKWEQKVQELTD